MFAYLWNLVDVCGTTLTRSQSLPFAKVAHQVSTLDAQPSNEQGGILVMVTGALLVWSRLLPS